MCKLKWERAKVVCDCSDWPWILHWVEEGCEDTRSRGTVKKRCSFQVKHQGVFDHQPNLKTGKRDPPPLKKNSDFGPAEARFASRVKAVFNKVMRMLGYVSRLFAGKYLTYLFFFSKLLKMAFRLPSLPFLISLSLFPLRAPFIASRHWNTAPN